MKKFRLYYWKDIDKDMFKEYIEKYKDRKKDYITVYIFDSYEEMYNKVDKLEKHISDRNYQGRSYNTNYNFYDGNDNYVKTGNMCGYIYLCDENNSLTFNTVAHEVSHSVIGYFGRKLEEESEKVIERIGMIGGVDNKSVLEEELYCYMVGNMCNEIIYQYEKEE